MKLDFSQPERWATLVFALKRDREWQVSEGCSEEELQVLDQLLKELDPKRKF